MAIYVIKNWKKFQHFKNRRPPWIKLYRDIIDDHEWFDLPAESAKFLVLLWVLASEDKTQHGYLPDIKVISFRCRKSVEDVEKLLITLSHWVEVDDINMISRRYQHGSPEAEVETETEVEVEGEKLTPATYEKTVTVFFDHLNGRVKKLGEDYPGLDIPAELVRMRNWLLANRGKRKSNFERFMVNWLNGEAKKIAGSKSPVKPGYHLP